MNYDDELIWPRIWLGPHKGRIARLACEACHWSYALPHLGQTTATEVLDTLRSAWGVHVAEEHDGHGFRHFDEAVKAAER